MSPSDQTPAHLRPRRRSRPLRGPARLAAMAGGWLLIAVSPFVGVIPGPGGVPVLLGGLVLVLQNSRWARRQFVRLSRRFPNTVMPLRHMLKRGLKPPTMQDVIRAPGRVASAMISGFLRLIGRPRPRPA